ncbi:hypothetical protein A3A20_00065 [Candidatus Wolfebacteria bacterium RIFCSPLOWO2_01_FULL_45_19]|uniref:Carbohydrate kinase PfkB domain-containing protein n=1 Tax=Candidatus Wolfebacteria bacterium RIFCSPLOWO2_01_FULL_45_19 TaxID=1802557 RepID=A0A1F8DRC4_9BACT|nr:MAG: hypothetical protein A3A20_00065 [Candidatus Wolfebacteria bacterium RIFCSPLOWO2_01_FULL_45_19]
MYDIITIGTATLDVFLASPLFKVLKDPEHLKRAGMPMGEAQCFALGAKIEVEQPILTVGGGAANAAVTFARQGLRAGAVVGIGIDSNGEAALKELKDEKIATLPVYDEKDMTGYSVILISSGGERTILHYRGASRRINGREPVFGKIKTKWIYVSPGGIPIAAIQRIITRFKNDGTKIAMNPSKNYLKAGAAKMKALLNKLDVVLVNREEAAYLTGIDYKNERGIFQKFDELTRGIAIMTDGPRGVFASDGKNIYKAGIFKNKKILDRTGAGDAFGSGFVVGLIQQIQNSKFKIQNLPPEAVKYAIRFASANATSVVERIGATEGILSKRDFSAARWARLPIKVIELN